jgi:ribA/ribD-fused uncharacterized protein
VIPYLKEKEDKVFVPFFHGVFSQWYKSPFVIDLCFYNCAEQWMMAEKARLFGDVATLNKIMASSSPKEQKTLGRAVNGFKEEVWLPKARTIVYRGNFAKFTQNPSLLAILLDPLGSGTTGAIGKYVFVETNPHDALWGVAMDVKDPDVMNPKLWKGKNWLGQVLTDVREDIIRVMNKVFVPDYTMFNE